MMRLRSAVALVAMLASLAGPCQTAALCATSPSSRACCCGDEADCQCHLGAGRQVAPATELSAAVRSTASRQSISDGAAPPSPPEVEAVLAPRPLDRPPAPASQPPPLLLTLAFRC